MLNTVGRNESFRCWKDCNDGFFRLSPSSHSVLLPGWGGEILCGENICESLTAVFGVLSAYFLKWLTNGANFNQREAIQLLYLQLHSLGY